MHVSGGHTIARLVDGAARQSELVATRLESIAARPEPILFGSRRTSTRIERGVGAFGDEIREAVQLLDGLPPSAARDALRGAMAPLLDPSAVAAAGRAALFESRSTIAEQVDSLRAWSDIAQLDDAARAAELARIRGAGMDQLDAGGWRRLGAIIEDDVAHALEPQLPRELPGTSSLARVAINVGSGGAAAGSVGSPWFVGRRYFDAWDATKLAPEQRIDTVQRLLARDPATVTTAEWRMLAGILHVQPDAARSVPNRTTSVLRITDAATTAGSGAGFADILRRGIDDAPPLPSLTTEAKARVAAELQGTEPIGADAQAIVNADRLDLVGLDGQVAILARLRHQQPVTLPIAERWLEDMQHWLDELDPRPGMEPLRDTALELATRNLRRMDGTSSSDPARPLWREPDYAELGRVRSIVQMLEMAGRTAQGAEQLVW